jgi:hypothetical protein
MKWGRRGAWVAACVLAACGSSERVVPVAAQVIVEPAELGFGRVPVLHSVDRAVRVTNAGRAPVRLEEPRIEAGEGAFDAVLVRGGGPLRAGESREVVVRFTPLSPGAREGTLVLGERGRADPVARAPVKGLGLPLGIRVSVPSLGFGRIELESEKVRTLVVENVSDVPVTVRPEVVGRADGQFAVQPVRLAPGEARETIITYQPTLVGRMPSAWLGRACPACAPEVVWLDAEGLEQAVVAQPPDVEFGQVALDRGDARALTVRNLSTEPFLLTGAGLGDRADASFTLDGSGLPRQLAGGATFSVPVRYSPGHAGPSESAAAVSVQSRRHPTTDFQLRAFGGAAELCVSPPGHDFGVQPVGSRTGVEISVRHCGSGNAAPLEVTEISLGGGALRVPGFSLVAPGLPAVLRPGEVLRARLRFEPDGAGPAFASFHVVAAGGVRLSWPVKGEGGLHAPCSVKTTPAVVDFGLQPPGATQVLGVKVANVGTDVCAVKDVRLLDAAGGAFLLPGGELEGAVLGPGDAFSFMVGFRSASGAAGRWRGRVGLTQSNPAQPEHAVSLEAAVGTPCLRWDPAYVDFGLSRPDCPVVRARTRLVNRCGVAHELRDVTVGPGTTDGEFELETGPVLPIRLGDGEAADVVLRYRARVPGMNLSPLFATLTGIDGAVEASLVGEASLESRQVDTWTQVDVTKADVLLVVDNTASMVEEHPRLVAGVSGLMGALAQAGLDARVAVTTTGLLPAGPGCPGGAEGGEAGRLFPADGSLPRWLQVGALGARAQLERLVQVGRCAQVEAGMEAARLALSPPLSDSADDPRTALNADGNAGFLREDAVLAVIFISDEDDHSPGPVADYAAFLAGLKGPGQGGRVLAHALVPAASGCSTAGSVGTRWAELVQRSGGQLASSCTQDYAPLLAAMASQVGAASTRFPLSRPPATGSLEVRLDGQPVTGWWLEPSTNTVIFNVPPPPGARVEANYERACGGTAP